jgi:hypothetical protein
LSFGAGFIGEESAGVGRKADSSREMPRFGMTILEQFLISTQ